MSNAVSQAEPTKGKGGMAVLTGEKTENPEYDEKIKKAIEQVIVVPQADDSFSQSEVADSLRQAVTSATSEIPDVDLHQAIESLTKAGPVTIDVGKLEKSLSGVKDETQRNAIKRKVLVNVLTHYALLNWRNLTEDASGMLPQVEYALKKLPEKLRTELRVVYLKKHPFLAQEIQEEASLREQSRALGIQINSLTEDDSAYEQALRHCRERLSELEATRKRELQNLVPELTKTAMGNETGLVWQSGLAKAAVKGVANQLAKIPYEDFIPWLTEAVVEETAGDEIHLKVLFSRLLRNASWRDNHKVSYQGGKTYEYTEGLFQEARDLIARLLSKKSSLVIINREPLTNALFQGDTAEQAFSNELAQMLQRVLGSQESISCRVHRPDEFYGFSTSEYERFPGSEWFKSAPLTITRKDGNIYIKAVHPETNRELYYSLTKVEDGGYVLIDVGTGENAYLPKFLVGTRLVAGGLGSGQLPERDEAMKKAYFEVLENAS